MATGNIFGIFDQILGLGHVLGILGLVLGLGYILGALGVSWAVFLGFLGIMLGALGPSWAPWGALGAHKAHHGRPESNFGAMLESLSVSYTHLTLPTILLV